MMTASTYTPVGLTLTPPHVYTFDGATCISVTQALALAGLVDRTFFTEADRQRGIRVHDAIAHDVMPNGAPSPDAIDPIVGPYLRAWRLFLAESAYRVDASEERLADRVLRVAGTLDLRGEFVDASRSRHAVPRVDVVDVKTGTVPPWVGLQVAGYVRLLPAAVRPRCRRWSLTLRATGTYTLTPLLNPTDERVFLAAVTIAHFRKGWL